MKWQTSGMKLGDPEYKKTYIDIFYLVPAFFTNVAIKAGFFSDATNKLLQKLAIQSFEDLISLRPCDLNNKRSADEVATFIWKRIETHDSNPFYILMGLSKEEALAFDVPLPEIQLSLRLRNILNRLQISSIADVLIHTPADLKTAKNMGRKSYDELFRILQSFVNNKTANYLDENTEVLSCPNLFREHREEVIDNDFDFLNGLVLDDKEKSYYEKIKNAHELLGSSLVRLIKDNDPHLLQLCATLNDLAKDYRTRERREAVVAKAYETIPTQRKSKQVAGFIKAYTNSPERRQLLLDLCSNETASIKDFYFSRDLCANDRYYAIGTDFLQWCSFNLANDLENIDARIYTQERDREIFYARVSGKTLQEVGDTFGITRGRVRQIEKRTVTEISKYLERNNILMKIYAVRNQDIILTPVELSEYFGERTELFLYVLRTTESQNYYYDSSLDVFVIENEDLADKVQSYVDALPATIDQVTLQGYVQSDIVENNLNEELLLKAVSEAYTASGNYLHRNRLTLKQIYTHIIAKYYLEGIRPYEDSTIEEFRRHVRDEFGDIKLPENNRAIAARIIDSCILCGKGEYKLKKEKYISKDLTKRLDKYIKSSTSKIIPVTTLFHVFENDLQNEGVDNRYYLQGILHEEYRDTYSFRRDYLFKDGADTSFYVELVNYIKNSDIPVSKADILRQYPGISDIVITLAVNDKEILNYFGEYLHASKLKVDDIDRRHLFQLLTQKTANGGFIHSADLLQDITAHDDMLLKKNGIFNQFSLFSALAYLFRDNFQFERPYVGDLNARINRPEEILAEFVREHDIVAITDIMEYARSLRMNIPNILYQLNKYNAEYLILDRERLASYSYVGVDEDILNIAEKSIRTEINETMAIANITALFSLPVLNVPWTDWLIYSMFREKASTLDVGVIGSSFREMIPVVAPKGKLDLEAPINSEAYTPLHIELDDLDDIDSLIDKIMDETDDDF